MKLVLLENIHPGAKQKMELADFTVESHSGALSESELKSIVQSADAIGIRSKTQLTESVLKECEKLKVIGAFCIGTNQIDTLTANKLGVPVFNAPYSNTRSVAELVISEIIALSRRLADVSHGAHQGKWLKSASGSHEVRGRVLGIVGYGHIGSQVSVLAEAIGLNVIYYDVIKKLPLGNARSMDSLDALLEKADFVTLHVPATEQTKNMISEGQLQKMKPESYLINASRGSVVDLDSLKHAIETGHIFGAAIDVFPEEPKNNQELFQSPMQGVKNVILTPHIGGSTEEAQYNIGQEVSDSLIKYLNNGSTTGAVNFPVVDLPVREGTTRILNVHQNQPGVLGQINSVVSEMGLNIEAQYLSTDTEIGYLVMDIRKGDAGALSEKIQQLPSCLRTRTVQQ